MYDNSLFQQLVSMGNSTGEVVGVDRFLVKVKGLDGVAADGLVLFESGQRGMVREVGADAVLVLSLNSEQIALGTLVVLQDNTFTTPVGESLVGRVISPLCEPLDDKGPLQLTNTWPVFNAAPSIMERSMLGDQLPSGVSVVDVLFPIVLGQRIAVLGDTKSGKSSFLLQMGLSQINTDRIVVYVLVGKRRVEIDQLLGTLNETGAMANSIVIVANVFDSLAQSYLAPYVGCAIAESFWRGGRDAVIVYDDLTAHAKIYREISLLSSANPGRDSYPGDMFYAHSSLLERAGKLSSNGKTLTALPVVVTPGDDITAYLPTSIMSITDGQIIFDLSTFRQNIRPAVNTGLSVSRVGGRARNARQKVLTDSLFKKLAQYRQASEFAHYGSDLAQESRDALQLGQLIHDAFRQTPAEVYSLIEQELVLEAIIASGGQRRLNVALLKTKAKELLPTITDETNLDVVVNELMEAATVGMGT